MLKTIIIEDEANEARMLQDCIQLVASECDVLGVATTLTEAKFLINKTNPDLAFFDVELPDGKSIDMLADMKEINFGIIFTTAHSRYAINAFQLSAIDFVIKPITPKLITYAIEKAKKAIYFKEMQEKINNLIYNNTHPDDEKKIVLQCADSIYYVNVKDIVHCKADNNYTLFVLNNGSSIMVSKTIKEFEHLLPASIFFRTHQSHIVNLNYISQIKKKSLEIHLKNNDIVHLATRKKDQLMDILKSR